MTFQEIHAALRAAGKPVSDPQLYRYMKRFGVKPEGALQIPRRYPAQSAAAIIAGLGIKPAEAPAASAAPPPGRGRVVSMKELRNVRKKAGAR